MNGAELKATLKDGGRVFGTMISIARNPKWIPILDSVGLDYVVIDTEHNYRSRGELGDFLIMMNTSGLVPIVRIPIPDAHYVTMAMDAGAPTGVSASWAVQPYTPVHPDPVLEPWRWTVYPELRGFGLWCLAEDHDGNMWFGVYDGVRRYDGTSLDGVGSGSRLLLHRH